MDNLVSFTRRFVGLRGKLLSIVLTNINNTNGMLQMKLHMYINKCHIMFSHNSWEDIVYVLL